MAAILNPFELFGDEDHVVDGTRSGGGFGHGHLLPGSAKWAKTLPEPSAWSTTSPVGAGSEASVTAGTEITQGAGCVIDDSVNGGGAGDTERRQGVAPLPAATGPVSCDRDPHGLFGDVSRRSEEPSGGNGESPTVAGQYAPNSKWFEISDGAGHDVTPRRPARWVRPQPRWHRE